MAEFIGALIEFWLVAFFVLCLGKWLFKNPYRMTYGDCLKFSLYVLLAGFLFQLFLWAVTGFKGPILHPLL